MRDEFFVGALVAGFIVGSGIGFAVAEDVSSDFATKQQVREACIRGNDRACRMYEVDYGR